MGPSPVPELPVWDPFTWKNGFAEIVCAEVPCNWFQCQENSIDPVHFEWMHDNWGMRQRGEMGPYAPKHLKLGFEEFDYGFTYKRIREGATEQDPLWTVGRVTLWPNGFYLGSHFEWRVPIDDENTLNICWFFSRVPVRPRSLYAESHSDLVRPDQGFERPLDFEPHHQSGHHRLGRPGHDRRPQQGTARHRATAASRMVRNRFFEDMEAVAQGKDPKGIVRDPEVAKRVPLPIATPEVQRDGIPTEQWRGDPYFSRRSRRFPWQYGQPEDVWREYASAMGVDPNGRDPAETKPL